MAARRAGVLGFSASDSFEIMSREVEMMDLSDLIVPEAIFSDLKASCKKQLLQIMAEKAAELSGCSAGDIFDVILKRERLGSTGVGGGIAIPHGKLAGLPKMTGIFARLQTPVDFEAVDDRPVDLVFMLLAPEGSGADHLKALSRVARLLRDGDAVAALRKAEDAQEIYACLTQKDSAEPPAA